MTEPTRRPSNNELLDGIVLGHTMGAAGVVNRLHVAMVLFGTALFLLLFLLLSAVMTGGSPPTLHFSIVSLSISPEEKEAISVLTGNLSSPRTI